MMILPAFPVFFHSAFPFRIRRVFLKKRNRSFASLYFLRYYFFVFILLKGRPLKIFRFILLFALNACVSAPLTTARAPRPAWLETPKAGCSSDELCAVGAGNSLNAARIDARTEISKILETKIDASSSTSETLYGAILNERISEKTNVLLNAAEIKETFEDGGSVYALAALDKPIAAAVLKKEIQKLDDETESALKEGSLPAVVRAERLFAERNVLNARRAVLTGSLIPDAVSFAEIASRKKEAAEMQKLFIEAAAPLLEQSVREALSAAGYVIASEKSGADLIVAVSFVSQRQHLNVEGFVRYRFDFKLEVSDKSGSKEDKAAASFSETGRTYNQAFENAADSYKKLLSDNIPSF